MGDPSYYIDPYSTFGIAHATPGITSRGDTTQRSGPIITPNPTTANTDPDTPPPSPNLLQESVKNYEKMRKPKATTTEPAKEVTPSPVPSATPTVEDIIVSNEKEVPYSLRYVIDFSKAGKVFTHSQSDITSTLTQIHSLFGDQEIRVTPEGVFLKDDITPRTKLANTAKAKEQLRYLHSRRSLLPLLREATIRGSKLRNGKTVHILEIDSSADLPLLITQHLGSEPVDQITLTLFVDTTTLDLLGGNFAIRV